MGSFEVGPDIVTCYFDDYVCISQPNLAANTENCFETLLDLLGWKCDKSGDKADEMSESVAALGVLFNLSQTKKGVVLAADVCSQIQDALQEGVLAQHAAASLKGRLGFAEGQLFGSQKVGPLFCKHSLHPPRQNKLQPSTVQALEMPRLVDCDTDETYLMFTVLALTVTPKKEELVVC